MDDTEEPKLYSLPFRGGTLEVWSDTSPGRLAIIAQLSLEDPRFDAFYKAAGVELHDPRGKRVFPPPSITARPLLEIGDADLPSAEEDSSPGPDTPGVLEMFG